MDASAPEIRPVRRTRLKNVARALGFGKQADWQKVLAFVAVWASAVIFALSKIRVSNVHTPHIWERPGYNLTHGYTYSLALILLPLLGLVWWYVKARRDDRDGSLRRLIRAVVKGALLTAAIFVLFDVLFASYLFRFPHAESVLGIRFWGYQWAASGDCSTIWDVYRFPACYPRTIPIEEIAFYLGGAAVLRGMYIWASEDFLSLYTLPPADYAAQARGVRRLVSLNVVPILIVATVFALGLYAKRQHDPGGYPVYLILQIVIIWPPLLLLYGRVKPFINTRALLMVMVLQVLVSVIWEATAAVPYGWWAYQPQGMIGQFVLPWSELPIEACGFWIGVGWSATFIHEATKIKVRSQRSWRGVLFGEPTRKDQAVGEPLGGEGGGVLSPG